MVEPRDVGWLGGRNLRLVFRDRARLCASKDRAVEWSGSARHNRLGYRSLLLGRIVEE